MPKARQTLTFKLPRYESPHGVWRKAIHRLAARSFSERALRYLPTERFELTVRIYMATGPVGLHDVDNRLKDVMDALQGRISGPKRKAPRKPIIPNDKQIWRVLIEKDDSARHKGHAGEVIIRRWRRR